MSTALPTFPLPALFPAATAAGLALRPSPESIRYQAVATWESYARGIYQTSTITRYLTLGGQVWPDGSCALDFHFEPPTLTKPEELESLERMALRLAALYERVSVRAAPSGQLTELLNYDSIRGTWEQLAQSLRDTTTAEDQITPTLIRFLDQQLRDPANVLQSLRHDYLYATLVAHVYAQPLGAAAGPRTRTFSQFFKDLPLYFTERVEVQPAGTGAHDTLTLVCHGMVDAHQTDVAAISRLMAPAGEPATGLPGEPRFHYEATYMLEPRTGLPQSVELTVYGRLPDSYNKQYNLTITRL